MTPLSNNQKNHSSDMINNQYKYSELTSKIIGSSITVHKALGNGFQEVIYQRALEIEMRLAGITFNREFEMPIFYREEQIGTRRVDFLVEGIISVELKAITKLEDVHFAQAINYLEAYNLEIGLLINFGEISLNFKRLTNKKYRSQESHQSNKSQLRQ
jgi:GxxExxY protein